MYLVRLEIFFFFQGALSDTYIRHHKRPSLTSYHPPESTVILLMTWGVFWEQLSEREIDVFWLPRVCKSCYCEATLHGHASSFLCLKSHRIRHVRSYLVRLCACPDYSSVCAHVQLTRPSVCMSVSLRCVRTGSRWRRESWGGESLLHSKQANTDLTQINIQFKPSDRIGSIGD